jgi:proteasome lid subunit RPN8/RPN11
MTTLILSSALRTQIEGEAQAAFPRECCGLIEGARAGDAITASALHASVNLSADADRFEIDPAAQFAALRTARGNRLEIVGCYHSHANGVAEPSTRDLAGAGEEGFVWLIAATASPDAAVQLAAFVFAGDRFEPVKIGI